MSMSGVSPMVQSGLLGQLVADSTNSKAQLDTLTEQSASGRVSDTYGGLDVVAASVSVNLRPQMASIAAWQQNISSANTTLDTTQSVLSQLTSIASSFSSTLTGASLQAGGAASVATQASQALQQVVSLLNSTSSDGQYVFAGTDSANPPIDTTALATFTADAATDAATMTTGSTPASVVSALLTEGTTSPFAYPGSSASGTTPTAQATQVGQNQSVPTAFVAGVNSYPVSSGSNTTGSYVRDIVTALAALAGLSSSTADATTLQTYGTALAQVFNTASNALSTETSGFGQVQSVLTTRTSGLTDSLTSLTKQVSSVEDVNMTETATALSAVQTQLQASYQLIANMKQLTLTTYI